MEEGGFGIAFAEGFESPGVGEGECAGLSAAEGA